MSTPLRQKMIEDMQLRGFAARTQESYLLVVSQLALAHPYSRLFPFRLSIGMLFIFAASPVPFTLRRKVR
jgi:predicted signal transduction protein with EAL and GGDEF domain